MIRRSKLPTDIGPMHPRLRAWMKDFVEKSARPISESSFVTVAYDPSKPPQQTTSRVRHRLPHAPSGFRVVSQDGKAAIYSGPKADRYYTYLRSDTAGVTVTIEIS